MLPEAHEGKESLTCTQIDAIEQHLIISCFFLTLHVVYMEGAVTTTLSGRRK